VPLPTAESTPTVGAYRIIHRLTRRNGFLQVPLSSIHTPFRQKSQSVIP
jgi:hypothetical protein